MVIRLHMNPPEGPLPRLRGTMRGVLPRRILHPSRRAGSLITECIFALALFTAAVFPLSYGLLLEAKYSRACYYRAAAGAIVDGELEILAAGEWRSFPTGRSDYRVTASAATNLPPGAFHLLVEKSRLRLEWRPAEGRTNSIVARERVMP